MTARVLSFAPALAKPLTARWAFTALGIWRGMASHANTAGSIPATFYRGGTSKAIFFREQDLPKDATERARAFRAAIGSPDPYGRQLNGMGGGLSSVSKIMIVDQSTRDDCDVEYTFVQVGVKNDDLDYGSNCGNMLSAVGPFAVDQGMVAPSQRDMASVKIYNTNTKKVIHASFPISGNGRADLRGDFAIDGVSGTGARIDLDFMQPGGSRTGLFVPSGHLIDTLSPSTIPGYQGKPIDVTLLDCGNPCVFVRAEDLGMDPTILPADLEKDHLLLDYLEQIRQAARVMMGLARDMQEAAGARSVPKVCIVSPPSSHKTLSGHQLSPESLDIVVRCISFGDPHRALPITASLCLAAAVKMPGTIPYQAQRRRPSAQDVVIGHPSGTIAVDATVAKEDSEQGWRVSRATVARTARKLFAGEVFVN